MKEMIKEISVCILISCCLMWLMEIMLCVHWGLWTPIISSILAFIIYFIFIYNGITQEGKMVICNNKKKTMYVLSKDNLKNVFLEIREEREAGIETYKILVNGFEVGDYVFQECAEFAIRDLAYTINEVANDELEEDLVYKMYDEMEDEYGILKNEILEKLLAEE